MKDPLKLFLVVLLALVALGVVWPLISMLLSTTLFVLRLAIAAAVVILLIGLIRRLLRT